MKFAMLLREDVTEVAFVQHRIVPYRAVFALLCGAFATPALGTTKALVWTAVVLLSELWTWFATRPAVRAPLTPRATLFYILSGAVTVPAWTALGVLYWFSSKPGTPAVALAMWAAQLIYTQRFIYQSRISIVVGNLSTVAALVLFPLFAPRFAFELQLPLVVAILFAIAFAISGAHMTMRNVNSLIREKENVEYAATHDGLTGLVNRGVFQNRLIGLIEKAIPCSVMFIDLDRFKKVNDQFGHQVGDLLLKQFTKRLQQATEGSACVARFGGDEFAVLSETIVDAAAAAKLAEAIIATARIEFALNGTMANIGASVGVALAPEHGDDPGELMRKADLALYSAKEAGRSDYRIFSAELDRVVGERVVLENALRDALETGTGLEMHYQPKFDIGGKSMGVEALLRSNHPLMRGISPDRLIIVAEETGMMLKLGEWILRECAAFAARWPELSVAINVAPSQLRDPNFEALVRTVIANNAIDPRQIEFEVTENTLMDDTGLIASTLVSLRKLGFRVALDDFGTGYSSLSHLHSMAVDRVKIDQTFVKEIGVAESTAIVQAVIQLAQAMGMQVTAEGVETLAHREFLSMAGVDEMQGYYFAKALPEKKLAALFRETKDRAARAA